jgi:hypothetical protein
MEAVRSSETSEHLTTSRCVNPKEDHHWMLQQLQTNVTYSTVCQYLNSLYQDRRNVKLISERRRVINMLKMKNSFNILSCQRSLIRERALLSSTVLRLRPFVLLVKANHG